jgi:hypothetical protein
VSTLAKNLVQDGQRGSLDFRSYRLELLVGFGALLH